MTVHKRISKNVAQVETGDRVILFSYDEPVAVKLGEVYYKTNQWRSVSTYQHIKNWLPPKVEAVKIPQAEINLLAAGNDREAAIR